MADCTHLVRGSGCDGHRAPRCALCGVVVGTRDGIPVWELSLGVELAPDALRIWGLEGSPWHAYAGSRPHPDGSAGRLQGWKDMADLELDAALAANTARIAFLANYVKAIGAAAPPALSDAEVAALPGCVGEMRLVVFALLGWCAMHLANAIRLRGGDYEGVVRPHRQREAPYSGYRHALAAAFLDEGALGGRGAGGLASPVPEGVEATHGLRGGLQFDTVTCHPTRSGTQGARGEGRVLSRIAAQQAVETARLGQQHLRGTAIDPRTGAPELLVVEPGTHLLSPAHVALLQLCDVGSDNGRARVENNSIVPAIDPLAVREARLRIAARGLPGAPRSDHEAASMLRAARAAVRDQFLCLDLIPPPERRRARAVDGNPFSTPTEET